MINNICSIPVSHGENGITVSLFFDLCRKNKLGYLLEHVDWKAQKPQIKGNCDKIICHLFPSFGRGQYGMGEPDAVIICPGNFAVFVEVETEAMKDFCDTFYKQFANFVAIGSKFEADKNRRFIKHYSFTEDKKRRTRGGYNTRKFISDMLKYKCKPYYLVIASGKPRFVDYLYGKIISRNQSLAGVLADRLGWLSLGSVKRFSCLGQETRKIIQFNLKG